jgi:cysteinyl-tRNA synthetase
MVIYDSRQKAKVPFVPCEGRKVNIYVCGPTVYDDAHLGHARSALTFDLLRRVLRQNRYEVVFASNITDVDDKIIAKAIENKTTIAEVSGKYTKNYFEQMDAIGVEKPDLTPKATQYLDAIYAMIQTLLDKDYAYKTSNGDIYFDTSKDAFYGSLSQKNEDETQTRARVASSEEKRNPKDFALFKADDGEYGFEAPFGKGRPGWHIECSAMIEKIFGKQIDIHGGGADLIFPHHENEAAQTRCACAHPLAKYWMHNGFVRIGGEKMSKSLGNSFYLKDALKEFEGEVIRFYLMSSHYRSDFNFSVEDLQASKKRLDKLYRLKKRLYGVGAAKKGDKEFENSLTEALSDDLNVSKALSYVDEFVASSNEALDKDENNKGLKKQIVASLDFIQKLLGLGCKESFRYFQFGLDASFIENVEQLIAERLAAKEQKDYAKADAIRLDLQKMGIRLMDTPQNTLWEKE